MIDKQLHGRASAPRWAAPIIVSMVLLSVAVLGCSVGDALVGRTSPTPTPVTKALRPTFTPVPGLMPTPPAQAPLPIRGALPPGVTVVPTGTLQSQPTSQGSIILYATNTPAPGQLPRATATATVPSPTPAPTLTPAPTPFAVVNAAKVTTRRGPGTSFEVVGVATQGQQLIILGQDTSGDWLLVCCVANQPVWLETDQVVPNGPLASVPMATARPTLPPSPTPRPPPPSSTPTQSPTPGLPFDIGEGPLFPIKRDTGLMTIWVKVWEGPPDNQKPLAGYILKVFRDKVDVSQPMQSHARSDFDYTHPEGNFEYNLKFEMPNAGEAAWSIYLARPNGYRVSPVTDFTTLGDSYRNQVVYIGYFLAR